MKFTILIEKTTQRKVIVDTDDEDSGRVAAVAGKGEAVNEGESRIKVLYAHPSSSEDVCNACQLAMPRHRCDACLDNPEREEPETEPTALGSLIDDKRHREDGMTLLSVHQKTGEQMTEHEMRLTVDQGWAAWDEFEMQGGGLYIHDEAKGAVVCYKCGAPPVTENISGDEPMCQECRDIQDEDRTNSPD